MTPKDTQRERERFERGKLDTWSTGGYGWTVKLWASRGSLKISWQDPASGRTKQKRLFAGDSQTLRERATRYAAAHAERLRAGELGTDEPKPQKKRLEEVTVFDVCLLYMRDRVQGFTASLFELQEKAVADWYRSLPESVLSLSTTPAETTVTRDVRSFQHLWAARYPDEHGAWQHPFRRERKVVDIEPADSSNLMAYEIAQGRSPRTVANEHDRLSAAFRHIVRQYRQSIGLTYNPIDGRKADRTRANVAMWSPAEVAKLRAKAREWLDTGRFWQVFVATGFLTSGRRRESVLHLTAKDHDFEAGTVLWRAEYAKGQGYGRGDSVRPMTGQHRAAALWAIQHRPNPLGPEYPILWMESAPARPMNEEHLGWQFAQLEKAAGIAHIRQRAIHSWRRTIVTLLADALGDGKAAEYVDMTVETVRGFSYKKTQSHVMEEAARKLDELLPEEGE